VFKPLAKTPEPLGQRGLVGWRKLAIVSVVFAARVVGHAFDTRKQYGEIAAVRRPQGRADHTGRVWSSQGTQHHR
jgi:hypothetical protein